MTRDVLLQGGVHRESMVREIAKFLSFTQRGEHAHATICHHEFEQRRPRLKRENPRRRPLGMLVNVGL